MSLFDSAAKPVRAAVVHVFATGPYHPGNGHGLLHVGLLPLVPDAQVQAWLLNPEREHSAAVFQACRISNEKAAEAPTWLESKAEVQAAFAQFDALLILDRAGQPSPERLWLEQVVLADLPKPPICAALDELLAFFLPQEVLDDADDLKEKLLADKAWRERVGYEKSLPQLPFVLHAMRRSVRWVLASLLRVQGAGSGSWLPAYALLHSIVADAVRRPVALRGFRLLRALAQQPDCCDDAPAPTETTREATQRRMPRPAPFPERPQAQQAQQLLLDWLARWRDQPDDATTPGLGINQVLKEEHVTEAFAELRKQVGADELKVREPQLRYARFVARAIAGEEGPYALEAGTGTGKTFGYLVPALEYLRIAPGAAVIVATSTKNLQEQMQHGELPALLRQPDGKRVPRYAAIRTAMLKGKNCYLCAEALGRNFEASFERTADWAERLAWLYLALRLRDTHGEVENIAPQVADRLGGALFGLLRRVTADRACRHGKLPDRTACVYPAHRKRAEEANLIIVNHHKLALLPPQLLERAKVCIVDEADRFPDNFRSALARTFNARELVEEIVEPLLGGPSAVPRRPEETPPTEKERTRRPPEGLLRELDARFSDEEYALWSKIPLDERPGATDAEQRAYEAWDEARLHDLVDQAALLHQVAEAMHETPAAADALHTAHLAAAAAAAAADPLRRRRALRTVRQAVEAVREPLLASRNVLQEVGQHFLARGREAARLPFPVGETHWQDEVWVRPAYGGRGGRLALAEPLQAALRPLLAPLTAAARELGLIARQLGTALNLGNAVDMDEEEFDSPPDHDERLRLRTVRLVDTALSQVEVLTRLLGEFPCRGFVPVLERTRDHDELGWNLIRKPYDLWPYLTTHDPTSLAVLEQLEDEPAATFAERQAVARQAAGRLANEPATPLFDLFRTVIFTSATLYVENKLDYFRRQLDQRVPFVAEERITSVFDFKDEEREPVLGSVPAYLPPFRAGLTPAALESWRVAQLHTLLPLLVALEGRTLVLFTSVEDLRFAAEWLAAPLAAHDIELICQRGASQWEIRRFRRVAQSVLLGVDRMWTGVDFAGPTLSQVIVWRLPFPSLGDVLISHRKRYEADDVFWNQFYRPAARLKLRQGFGRLVRREKDRGAFVILDARVAATFYADVLEELEIPLTPDPHAHALLTRTTGPLLHLLKLGTEFQRRGLSLEKLVGLLGG
ncbi:ATP-dependent DNA helicase [Hymenobacter sp. BT507]|uniref:ATP-dependent DNA helicase n=1 Tax=Hymenobacter citatus TaxID=2763506 RepID=A0ABR7MEF8_9BACT|nr:ATP-dependent DNA helicase [Hymenobacter citatus]MBC6609472.1 ATP-dependent DNA helicase [Hymenobacter citatus]